jgi:hypothetical protein
MGASPPSANASPPVFTIKPMDIAESSSYLRHNLALAGRDEPLFADDAIARVRRDSGGLPRALNNAAHRRRRRRGGQGICQAGF